MLLWIYRILFVPVVLLLSPFYLLRMRRRGGYARHFGDRFGGFKRVPPKQPGRKRVWLQAVSVGEMLAVGPLLEELGAEGTVEWVLTTTTSTGLALAEQRYRALTIGIGYFPIDFVLFSSRAWAAIDPDLVILMEGERWPEHLAQARRRNVPVVCINGRLSDRSYRRLRRLRWAAWPLLRGIKRVLAGSEHDAQRFKEIGFPAEDVTVTGNLKVDVNVSPLTAQEVATWRESLGFGLSDPILLGASTWPGEEAAMLAAFAALRLDGSRVRLLIVPRHAERRGEIEPLLERSGFSYHVRSRGPITAEVDVVLADTTGELQRLTAVASLVFVGKSLPPHHEGQTPIEAAALAKPVLFGPRMTNFRSIAEDLVACGAAVRVASGDDLRDRVMALWRDPRRRERMAAAAAEWHRANCGALERSIAVLQEELGRI